jgi:hypothetical protein
MRLSVDVCSGSCRCSPRGPGSSHFRQVGTPATCNWVGLPQTEQSGMDNTLALMSVQFGNRRIVGSRDEATLRESSPVFRGFVDLSRSVQPDGQLRFGLLQSLETGTHSNWVRTHLESLGHETNRRRFGPIPRLRAASHAGSVKELEITASEGIRAR